LLDQPLRFRKPANAFARLAFAARIVLQAFAIRCLREEPREREFADSRRSGKKQGMRHAFASKGAAQCGHNPFRYQEIPKRALSDALQAGKQRTHGGQNIFGNLFRHAHRAARCVKALNRRP